MFHAFQNRRLILFTLVLLVGFGLLEWRLYQLQVVRHEELACKARAYFEVKKDYQAARGEIRDCCGRPIAMIRPVKNVFIDPCKLGTRTNEMSALLARWLHMEPGILARTKLQPRLLRHDSHGVPIYDNKVCLKLGATLEEWDELAQTLAQADFGFNLAKLRSRDKVLLKRLQHRAVFAEDDQVRVYPRDRLLCHLLGIVDHDPATGALVPEWGLEKLLDQQLAGSPGRCESVRDVNGWELPNRRKCYREPEDGLNVHLTIDARLQEITARELKAGMDEFGAQGAVAVMVRVRTGEILAMASLPDYSMEGSKQVPTNAWRNRVIQDLIEPGSTFKIILYSAAMNEGLIDWDQWVDCQDTRGIPRPMTDHERLGVVPRWMAFAKSSNQAAAQVGLLLGPDRYKRYIAAYGLYEPTGLGLEGERFARMPTNKLWSSATSLTRAAIGYGVAATPLQLTMAMNVLANGGRLMKPLLVSEILDNEGNVVWSNQPQCVRSVVTPATAQRMLIGLKAVVSKDGTGLRAKMDNLTVAGKTGTARMAGPHGYEYGKYRSTFAGFFPADEPEVCLLVMFDQPGTDYFGGHTAAPVFKKIAEQTAAYLHLAPESKPSNLITRLP